MRRNFNEHKHAIGQTTSSGVLVVMEEARELDEEGWWYDNSWSLSFDTKLTSSFISDVINDAREGNSDGNSEHEGAEPNTVCFPDELLFPLRPYEAPLLLLELLLLPSTDDDDEDMS